MISIITTYNADMKSYNSFDTTRDIYSYRYLQ